ncbi:MAG: hypothetical protein IJX10_02190 [Phascolarctobacterium sp.]|nr:hypothetical protein [Phascolarctobacterium sp.]
MNYTDEELEYYLELWQNSEEETITVDKKLLLSLANEVLTYCEQPFEEMDVRMLSRL